MGWLNLTHMEQNSSKKILICGSRTITDEQAVFRILDEELFSDIPRIREIVSGGARGIDHIGEKWAHQHGIGVRLFVPQWEKGGVYGRSAGIVRNRQMVDYADEVIAIWDGQSKGTESTIGFARDQNKLRKVIKM